ncbi:MAG: hypothetical protein R3E10_10090 [Gemmatimonadota bacterium]
MNAPQKNADLDALGATLTTLLQAPFQVAAALTGVLARRSRDSCEIPPPCWEPQPAGSCTLTLTPGSTGTLRIRVSNCGWSRHLVGITALGRLASVSTHQPTTLALGPHERATFTVSVQVPKGVKAGEDLSGILIVRGCRDHYVQVTVRVAECAQHACCDVQIEDCADQIHHWYEHFYCPRPCRTAVTLRVPTDG